MNGITPGWPRRNQPAAISSDESAPVSAGQKIPEDHQPGVADQKIHWELSIRRVVIRASFGKTRG